MMKTMIQTRDHETRAHPGPQHRFEVVFKPDLFVYLLYVIYLLLLNKI